MACKQPRNKSISEGTVIEVTCPSVIELGYRSLHINVFPNEEIMTRYLVGKESNVNAQDQSGMTALMRAVLRNSSNIVRILLKDGADIDILNNEGKSALHMAFIQDRLKFNYTGRIFLELFYTLRKKCLRIEEIAKQLIESGCKLYQIAYTKDAEIIECMLRQGSQVDCVHPKTMESALYVAVVQRDVESVKVLLNYGADGNAINVETGASPLLVCCLSYDVDEDRENDEMLRLLLEKYSAVRCTLFNDIVQITKILMDGSAEALDSLLRSELAMKFRDQLLHRIALNRNPGVIDVLKRCNFNVNALDEMGASPLHYAASETNVDMIEYLLEHGAKIDLANIHSDKTAVAYAYDYQYRYYVVKSNYEKCTELLFHHNADPQVIFQSDNYDRRLNRVQKITIFDTLLQATSSAYVDRLNPAIAHLALLEKRGTEIKQVIRDKINSNSKWKRYFDRCRRILKKRIFGSVTIFELLTQDSKKIMRYSKNEKLIEKLNRVSYKQGLRLSYSYYCNSIKKRMMDTLEQQLLKNRAAQIVCEISENRFDADNLVVRKMMKYLTVYDLRNLYNV